MRKVDKPMNMNDNDLNRNDKTLIPLAVIFTLIVVGIVSIWSACPKKPEVSATNKTYVAISDATFYTNTGKVCVTALPTYEAKQFCSDVNNVSLWKVKFIDRSGTFAEINTHVSRQCDFISNGKCGPGRGSVFTSEFTDWISIQIDDQATYDVWCKKLGEFFAKTTYPRQVTPSIFSPSRLRTFRP